MSLSDEIRAAGVSLSDCYQCQKCTSACPIVGIPDAFDLLPHQIFRMIDMDRRDEVLNCSTIWVCTSCEMCSARCPVRIDVGRVIDLLRRIAFREGKVEKEPRITSFHRAFLESVESRGRMSEFGAMRKFKKEQGELFKDFGFALNMFKKGKLRIFSSKVSNPSAVSAMFEKARQKEQG